MRGDRSSFPIRDMSRESASRGHGEVKTWKMSPEELEDYRARNAYIAPTNSSGVVEKRGMDLQTKPKIVVTDDDQPGRAKVGRKPTEGPDKDFVLTRIAAGKNLSSIERELGMKVNGLHYWIRKWDWVGITPGKARAILSGELAEEVIGLVNEKATEAINAPKLIVELEGRITQLETQNTEVVAASGKAIEQLNQRIIQLTEDRDLFQAEALRFEKERNEALQAVRELEEERTLLLQTIESTVENAVEGVFVETVNHPEHYTAGGIEVIDFIVAKLTEEEFTGFCKGNILKYASRANHKGGFEDLRKTKWYVDRLIEEVNAK